MAAASLSTHAISQLVALNFSEIWSQKHECSLNERIELVTQKVFDQLEQGCKNEENMSRVRETVKQRHQFLFLFKLWDKDLKHQLFEKENLIGLEYQKNVLYVADQILLKSETDMPNSQLSIFFSPEEKKEMELFEKYRYSIALTLAIKFLSDLRVSFSPTFICICNDKEMMDIMQSEATLESQKELEKLQTKLHKQNTFLERKFLDSTGFWFPLV